MIWLHMESQSKQKCIRSALLKYTSDRSGVYPYDTLSGREVCLEVYTCTICARSVHLTLHLDQLVYQIMQKDIENAKVCEVYQRYISIPIVHFRVHTTGVLLIVHLHSRCIIGPGSRCTP